MSSRYVWSKNNYQYIIKEGAEDASYSQRISADRDPAFQRTDNVELFHELEVDSHGQISGTPYDIRHPSVSNNYIVSPPRGTYFRAYQEWNDEIVNSTFPEYMYASLRRNCEVTFLGGDEGGGSDEHFLSIRVQYGCPVTAEPQKGSAAGTVSNASSSTYPLNNSRPEAAIICAISAALLRRCSRVN